MKKIFMFAAFVAAVSCLSGGAECSEKLRVVTTLPDYKVIAQFIGDSAG